MAVYIFGAVTVGLIVVTQLYTILAAGTREFDLEDSEQEQFIHEWKEEHSKTR